MGYVLGCRLVQHPWLFIWFESGMSQAINSSLLNIFSQLPLINDLAEVGIGASPVALLDDTSVHIDNHHGAIGRGCGSKWTEVDVRSTNEFRFRIRIRKNGFPVFANGFGAANQAGWGA